ADSTAVRGYDNYLVRERQTVVIEQGQSSVKFSLPYDRRLRAYYNWFTVGYNCSSLSCEDHALTEYGWLTNLDENRDSLEVSSANHRLSDNSLHISPPGSGYYLGGMAAVDDEKGWYALLDPIVMLQNLSLPVTVKRDRLDKDPSNIINGRIQSYKKYTRLYCWGFSGDIYLFEGNGTCINPVYGNESKVLSESKFTIDANELTGEVLVNVEPLEQAEIPAEADQAVDDLDHQYFAFVCDEGCNDFDPDQVGYYLGSNSIFSGTNLASAHKFNFTNEFYESQIVIPLARFKGFPWLFELLEE
ncbi:MAG: hypothetical protein KTR16_11100, partial [Acidiferrobacterales bacterium]|nr:hypothetical protein [Acidiferrobacterales bacterium]